MQVLIANNNTIEWSHNIGKFPVCQIFKEIISKWNSQPLSLYMSLFSDFITLTTLDILICPIQSYDIFQESYDFIYLLFLNLIQKDHELCDLSHLSKF